ncbi:MAG: protein kinase [Myxococcota bacterium]
MQHAQPQRLVPHERIGRYEVLRKIATGGMAELFLAKHVGMEGFEKVVAIKRILSHLAYDEEFINMFRDEARLVAKLSHPNIVQIYDLGKSNESYFIAMEYIPGRNLASIAKKARTRQEPLPPPYISRCIAQACEALYYAHTRTDLDGRPMGIVHRDVSPQNIIVAFSGTVKLVDFGIAKAATKIAHTRAGVLKGKYAYMSPEQIKGEEIDARSDLFSVGIVLYELLCGKRPFEKDNSIQTLKAIVQEPHVDPRVINPQIPDGLADIINKALSKNRDVRYQSAQEVQLALEDFVTSTGARANNVVIGQWLSTLFEDEIDKQRGGTITFKGVGEVILPADEKPDVADPQSLLAPEESVPPPTRAAPSPSPLERGRGGGSIENNERKSTANGRGGLLKEGVIDRPTRGGDDEATHLAGKSEPPHDDSAGVPVASASDDDRPHYEEGVMEGEASLHDPYEDSATEHVPEGSPLAERLKERVESLFEPKVANVAVRATSLMETLDGKDDPEPRGWPPGTLDPPMKGSEEATVEPGNAFDDLTHQPASDEDDQWGDRTAANPEEGGDELFGASPAVVTNAHAWEEPTAGPTGPQPSVRSSFGNLDDATLAGVPEDDLWGEKTSANPDDPADMTSSGGVEVIEPDRPRGGLWVDKTTGSPDPSDPDPAARGSSGVGFDDGAQTFGRDAEEPNTEWGGDLEPDPPEDDPDATNATAAWRAMPKEEALPVGIDIHRDVNRDSRTVAATSDAFLAEGIEIPASGAFAYDAETAPGEDVEPPAKVPQVEAPKLGAIKLAKAAAAPRGGVKEAESSVGRDLDLGLEVEFDRSTQEVQPPAPLPKKLEPPPAPPKKAEAPRSKSLELERPAPKKKEPPKDDPLSGPGLPDFDDLFKIAEPKPMVGADPLAMIGSTRVPPASVSLSEMLMDTDDRSRHAGLLKPAPGMPPRVGSTVSLQNLPSPPIALGKPVVPGARPASIAPPASRGTAMRHIKEVHRAGAALEPGAASSPPNLPIPGLGTPVAPGALSNPAYSNPAYGNFSMEAPAPAARFSPLQIGIIAVCAIVISAVAMAFFYVKFRSPSLEISSVPPGARVLIGGRQIEGTTPLSITIEAEKDYPVQVLLDGYEPFATTVKLPRGRRAWRASYPLKPVSAASAAGTPTPAPDPSAPPPPAP